MGAAAGLLCLLSPRDCTSRKVTAALSSATTLLLLVRLRRRRGSTFPLPRIWAGSMLGGLEPTSRSWAFSLATGWVCHAANAGPCAGCRSSLPACRSSLPACLTDLSAAVSCLLLREQGTLGCSYCFVGASLQAATGVLSDERRPWSAGKSAVLCVSARVGCVCSNSLQAVL